MTSSNGFVSSNTIDAQRRVEKLNFRNRDLRARVYTRMIYASWSILAFSTLIALPIVAVIGGDRPAPAWNNRFAYFDSGYAALLFTLAPAGVACVLGMMFTAMRSDKTWLRHNKVTISLSTIAIGAVLYSAVYWPYVVLLHH